MKKLVLLQPGKLGDLIICSPIAEYYADLGYEVEWVVYSEFEGFFREIPYSKCITFSGLSLSQNSYLQDPYNRRNPYAENLENAQKSAKLYLHARRYAQLVHAKLLDISWGFPGNLKSNLSKIESFRKKDRNWIDMRYTLSEVPLEKRWNFNWNRNEKKEDELLSTIKERAIKKYNSDKYSIVHIYKNHPLAGHINAVENPIVFEPIADYQIYDWFKVLQESESISCVDSSLCNFVEVIPSLQNKKKIYLGSEESHYDRYMRNILQNNWIDESLNPIHVDYEEVIKKIL